MIEPKLWCIMFTLENSDEPFTLHTVGVDMDEGTAVILAKKYTKDDYRVDDEIEDILEYYEVTVEGFDITVVEKEK